MKWIALGLCVAGLGLAAFVISKDPWAFVEHILGERWSRYKRFCKKEITFLQENFSFESLVTKQVFGLCVVCLLALLLQTPLMLIFGLVVACWPAWWLSSKRRERVTKIEAQLDGWLLALANGLKASPSLGDALKETANLVHPPISQELTLLMKEYQLGISLDQALNNMCDRVGSRSLRTAVSTLLIARETGGDLSSVLETSAAALREMARLEGVVRTKTAEGKAQASVLGAVPPIMFGIMYWLDPNMVRPLWASGTGQVVFVVAIVLWIMSVPVAIRVLTVDI